MSGTLSQSLSRRRVGQAVLAAGVGVLLGGCAGFSPDGGLGPAQAIEAEAQAQAICMQTEDFKRAFEAFAAKRKPVFGGD